MRRKRRRRGISVPAVLAALALVLAAAASAALVLRHFLSAKEEDGGGPDVWEHVIAYVPLDDRTDNLEDVILLAEASGWELLLPDRDLFRTALDGQARNADGGASGNREALFRWVRDMEAAGCRRFVLSLDQLFSGGLVNSRSVSSSRPLNFTDSDGTVRLSEAEAFDAYLLPLADKEENRVYLFDSVTRLSPTVGYGGLGAEEYYALRAYGMVPRAVLSGENLTLKNIFAAYPYAADGETAAEERVEERFREPLTEEVLQNYLGVRRRKLSLLDHVLDAVEGRENLRLLIGVDDSSNAPNIQYNELNYIQRRMGPRTDIMAGLDSVARLLVGLAAQEEAGYQVKASVRYVGGTEGRHSSEFDLYTLEEVVDLHLDFFHARKVNPEAAELQFVVMTAPADWEHPGEYREELVSLLEYNIEHHIPTVLNEASNNAYGDALETALLERVDFAGLVAYAGKYDQANVTGAAFAMGFSRYLYLRCREDHTAAADAAQVCQMANSMALTEYTLHTRAPLNEYVEELGVDPDNMRGGQTAERLILRKLRELFLPECRKVCRNLEGTRLLTSLDPEDGGRTVGRVSVTDLYFPWNRTFEVAFTVKAGGFRDGAGSDGAADSGGAARGDGA